MYLKDQAEMSKYRVSLLVFFYLQYFKICLAYNMYHIQLESTMVLLAMTGEKNDKRTKKHSRTKVVFCFFFQIDADLIAYEKKVFFRNSWNVFRWYMFKDSRKLATKKTQQQLALLHIKWQEGGEGGYKPTKKICTTTCCYLAVAAPAGLLGKAIT